MIEIVIRHQIELSPELRTFLRIINTSVAFVPAAPLDTGTGGASPEITSRSEERPDAGPALRQADIEAVMVRVAPAAAVSRRSATPAVKTADLAAPTLTQLRFPKAREDIIRREWPAGTETAVISQLIHLLPGEPATNAQIAQYAWRLGVKRPIGQINAPKRKVVPIKPAVAEPVPAPTPAPVCLAEYAPPPAAALPVKSATIVVPDEPIPADFQTIKDSAAKIGIRYDGGNMDQVNKARARLGWAPYVQVG